MSAGPRILLVEDDADHRKIVTQALVHDGIAVTTAATGVEALERLSDWTPDLILLDLELPRLDGWEAARRIRARPEQRNVPIVAFTASVFRGGEALARQSGCDDFLVKPCTVADLRACVGRWLRPPSGRLSGGDRIV